MNEREGVQGVHSHGDVVVTSVMNKSPSSWSIVWRELVKDRLAIISLVIVALFLIFTYGSIYFINQDTVTDHRPHGH